MRLEGVVLVFAAAMLGLAAAHFPGSFHNIMMMIGKKDGTQRLSWKGPTKMARIAPSPPRMWAVIDPPGSLGSLSNTNRIARSLKSIDEAYDNEESPSPIHIVRSVSNRREARTEEDEEVTEAPEEVTESPEETTEDPEEEVVEEETEPPVTTPAPVICGGDLTTAIDPNNLPEIDTEGRILHKHILSPGFEEREYPDQDFECEWTIGVGKECQMGMLMFVINEGEIRETARCEDDHLAVSYRGGQENKFCGMLKQGKHQVAGTDIWTESTELAMKLTFRASERPTSFPRNSGKPVGFNMTISCYCWIWSEEFLAQATTTTTTTTTITTTTEAPVDEPVTTISEDGQGYDDEVTEADDTVTVAPQENAFDESGERFFDIANDLVSNDAFADPLLPELSSASSVGSFSSIASLISDISPQEGSNALDLETLNTDVMNTEALNPIVSEAGFLPLVSVQPGSLPIIPGELVSTSQNDESHLNTNSEEEVTSNSTISSLENTDSKVSEPKDPIPVHTKPVPVDTNPQVTKPKPNNSDKQSGANKPNKKPNKNKPTKPPTTFIPFIPLRDDSNLMESDTPYIGEKINFEPILNQLLTQ